MGSTVKSIGALKSAVSRRLIKGLERALEELLSHPLDRLDLLALVIDGVVVAEHTAVVALGIDSHQHCGVGFRWSTTSHAEREAVVGW